MMILKIIGLIWILVPAITVPVAYAIAAFQYKKLWLIDDWGEDFFVPLFVACFWPILLSFIAGDEIHTKYKKRVSRITHMKEAIEEHYNLVHNGWFE